MNRDSLAKHLRISRYGNFELTDAVRPAQHLPIIPREGFRVEIHQDAELGFSLPVLTAAVSKERLFEVFMALLEPLQGVVDVVLESSHIPGMSDRLDLRRSEIDLPVLMSHLYDFEDLLMNDGCTGVAVLSQRRKMEVQFDEHKLLVVYAKRLKPFRRILKGFDLWRDQSLDFICEDEHLHSSAPEFESSFSTLCYRLGVGDTEHVLSDGRED